MTTNGSYEEYGQHDTADLVRSVALSSAKLWEEVFDRLRQLEHAQSELRQMLGRIESQLPAGTGSPALSAGEHGTNGWAERAIAPGPTAGEPVAGQEGSSSRTDLFEAGPVGFGDVAPTRDAVDLLVGGAPAPVEEEPATFFFPPMEDLSATYASPTDEPAPAPGGWPEPNLEPTSGGWTAHPSVRYDEAFTSRDVVGPPTEEVRAVDLASEEAEKEYFGRHAAPPPPGFAVVGNGASTEPSFDFHPHATPDGMDDGAVSTDDPLQRAAAAVEMEAGGAPFLGRTDAPSLEDALSFGAGAASAEPPPAPPPGFAFPAEAPPPPPGFSFGGGEPTPPHGFTAGAELPPPPPGFDLGADVLPPPPPGFGATSYVPPPPPGFSSGGDVPPPPPGFGLGSLSYESAPSSEWSAVPDAPAAPSGFITSAVPPPPPGFGATADVPPPPPPGFSNGADAPLPPPPPGFGATADVPPPPPGFSSGGDVPPPPPPGFGATADVPPPPPGFSNGGQGVQPAPGRPTAFGASIANDAKDVLAISNGAGPNGSTETEVVAVGNGNGRGDDSPPPPITPDFFARAGRRRH
jgi:hypothetical protein